MEQLLLQVPCHGASLDDLRSRLTVAAQRLAAAANDTSSAIQASASVTCEGAPRPPEPPGAQAPPPPDEPAYDAASVGDPIHADWTAAHRRQRRRGSRLLLQQAVTGRGAGSPGASAVPASSATASDCATVLGSSISQAGTAGLLPGQSLLRVSVRLDVTAPSAVPAQANSGSHGGGSGGALDAVSGLAAAKEVASALAAWRTSAASNVTRNAISSSAASSASGASSSEVLAALEGLCIPSAMHLTVLAEVCEWWGFAFTIQNRTQVQRIGQGPASVVVCTHAHARVAGVGAHRPEHCVRPPSVSSPCCFLYGSSRGFFPLIAPLCRR